MLIMLFLIVVIGAIAAVLILTISKTVSRIEFLVRNSEVHSESDLHKSSNVKKGNANNIPSEASDNLFLNAKTTHRLNKPELLALYDKMPAMLQNIDQNTQLIDASGFSYNVPCQVVNKDGEVTDLLLSATGVKDVSGEFINTNVVLTNVTERKRVEDERDFTQNMLIESSKMANVGGWEIDLKTQNVYWSSVAKEIYEVSSDFIPDIDSAIGFCKEGLCRDSLKKSLNAAVNSGASWDLELQVVTANNQEKWVNSKGKIRKEKGEIVGVYGTFQDISDRKNAEKKLKKSETDLRKAEKLAKVGNWRLDIKGMNFICSDQFLKIYGASKTEDISDAFIRNMVHPDDLDDYIGHVKNIFNSSHVESVGYRIIVDNEIRYLESFTEQYFNDQNEVVKLFGTVQDVSVHKYAEKKLKRSETDLRKAEKLSKIGNWRFDKKEMIFTCSDEMVNIYGVSKPEDITNEFLKGIIHPDDLDDFIAYTENLYSSVLNESFAYRIIVDGEIKNLEVFAEQYFNERNEVVKLFGTVQDVTKRKTLENKLQKKNLYLKVLAQTEKEFLKADSKWYLSDQFSKILTQELNYAFVQIKLCSEEKGHIISTVGANTKDTKILKDVTKWSNSTKTRCPDKDVFISRKILILRDLSNVSGYDSWKQSVKKSGFKSFVSIPFFYSDEAKGVFNIYLNEEWKNDKEEIELLKQVANDFAFGLHSLKINEEKTKLSNFNTMLASSLNVVSANMNLVNNTIRFNGECKYVLGYTIKEMGPNLGEFKHKIHPNDLTVFQQKLENVKEPQFDIEYRYKQPSGNYRWLNTIGHMHYNENNEAVKMTAIIINIDSKKNEESNSMKAEIKGKDLERKRIAEEIHDSLGQTLTVASMSLDSIKDDVQLMDGGKRSIFANAQALVNQAITETREISHNLMPATLLDFGLIPSLSADIKKLNKTGKIQFTLYHYYVPERFDPEIEINIYKIIKEAINNILKHSKAKTASIQLFVQNDFLTVMIEDDGVGFSKSRNNQGEGIGLRNLKNRVESIGGEIIIERTKGVLISIEVQI